MMDWREAHKQVCPRSTDWPSHCSIHQPDNWEHLFQEVLEDRETLLRAMWDARTTLGFDPDGDSKFHSRNMKGIAELHVQEAAEIRRDMDEMLDEIPLAPIRTSD